MRNRSSVSVVLVLVVGLTGCKDLTGNQQLPAGTVNPSSYNTPSGAYGMRTAVLYALEQELPNYIVNTGLLTDELESNTIGASQGVVLVSQLPQGGLLDARVLPSESYGFSGTPADADYSNLQKVRGSISQALGAIAAYDTGRAAIGNPAVTRGELYALGGYTEILLADFFCSGVPLSTLDFQRDFTYRASSNRDQVYLDAIAKLDSAMALADTSTNGIQVLNLARVLKGRALLALDSVAAAGQAVSQVPQGFQYVLSINWDISQQSQLQTVLNNSATVSDNEGGNGLPYISSLDPRTATTDGPGPSINGIYAQLTFPARYSQTGFSPFIVADWIEARLIQAEAAYRAGHPSAMVDTLNVLRTTATVQNQTATLPGDLTDPGSDSARAVLLFQERAQWLFLTGHRQGDLRRLLRRYYSQWYHNSVQLYPTGPYLAIGTSTYGTDITAPIPGSEFLNPLFHGCLDRAP